MKRFLHEYELIFSIEKIKSDLLNYLEIEQAEVRRIISAHEIDGVEQVHFYSAKEPLTILALKLQKKYHGIIYLPFQVDVLIGKVREINRNLELQNYIAEMLYDKDYELITVDFIHRTAVRKKGLH
jgi:hypothetical protein